MDSRGHRYLLYTEDTSKTNQGGIGDRKTTPKEVRAYESSNKERCYVRLFEKYRSLWYAIFLFLVFEKLCFSLQKSYIRRRLILNLVCFSTSGKDTDIFYFKPATKQTPGNWFTKYPVGHNTLQGTIKRLCEASGIRGKTNHSLRATAATRLYQANVEEQLICDVTGSSV